MYMSKELVDNLTQEPGTHSAYIEDSEIRDMVIAWAVVIRNELSGSKEERYAVHKKYTTLMENMDPTLYKRFGRYIAVTCASGTDDAEWSQPAERIRKTLLPK